MFFPVQGLNVRLDRTTANGRSVCADLRDGDRLCYSETGCVALNLMVPGSTAYGKAVLFCQRKSS